MDTKDNTPFTEIEIDTLQEIMNISFGNAAAELADVIDIFINLKVPVIRLIKASELHEYVKNEINDFKFCSIVEQRYHGEISGVAFLIFPHGVEREFLSYFQDKDIESLKSDILIELEKEVIMEVGNLLIGACIGKIFELLDGIVTYEPPRSIVGENFQNIFIDGSFKQDDYAITMKTHFNFEDRDVSGYLFLMNSEESTPSLKNALSKFLDRFM